MLLTVKEAAARACVSVSLVYAWVAERTLRVTRVGRKGKRGHIRIEVEDLDGVLASLTVGKKEPEPVKAPVPKKAPGTFRHLNLR